ncbi:hypothetical protein [Burkholderia sp.]|uniref:hypothetical protein n=1 Tax=Burkholderia sp. TaxID=36773 RepID=UPI0025C52AA0|nr:hypothetical protein [Burkholderia sp.]MBS6359174.1 hypothetical protein [Burkholderia sp.]
MPIQMGCVRRASYLKNLEKVMSDGRLKANVNNPSETGVGKTLTDKRQASLYPNVTILRSGDQRLLRIRQARAKKNRSFRSGS